ncbi:dihydrodipicolinate synthase family protein [Streptomyces cocklensis]|jgi:4-hydroxy-tetrahydrodipicolinate synthase|uniref:Dihydrodipicolinate synthase n=1 Tax=Actinacidiphila cocklensis TaxID=887465 RepID=A0A9W4GQ76_9ACTN|nr:dihydrodipicolinate synthase family protein [Actinacidiphila cocklensis]MDD1061638.1 dihydrodipicolinate synthase family protein [Actinacidiphila cocklensis]CAG6392384.1 Dihydrodipicolinate synthase [Actinacidiphila cocklensis]
MSPALYVPLVTPFAADGGVDYGALEALARDVLAQGADGLVALGTTGEPGSLDEEERGRVAELVGRVCRAAGARFVLGVGDGRRGLGEWAVAPDAVLVTVPAFVRPGEAGVVAHFAGVAARSDVPLVVYHVPYRTGQQLTARALRELAAIPGVAGVKYAVGGIDAETVDLLGDRPAGFDVLAGDDVFAPAMLALGATGAVLASAHLDTAAWVRLAATGDRELGHRLAAQAAALFREPNPTVIKAALHAQGRIPTPGVRLPLLPASPQALAGVRLGT